jgi:signal peptidase I
MLSGAAVALLLAGPLALGGCDKRRFKMPSGSMLPSLAAGTSFVADRSVKRPTRGEVWVFEFPENREQNFAKRLVAGPGDRVEVRGGKLQVNGKPLPTCVVGRWSPPGEGPGHDGELVLEKLDAGAYLTFREDQSRDPAGPWEVKVGEWFAVGDNRNNSHDSRSWNGGLGGGVPQAMLLGRVEMPPLALPAGAEGLAAGFAKCQAELGVK